MASTSKRVKEFVCFCRSASSADLKLCDKCKGCLLGTEKTPQKKRAQKKRAQKKRAQKKRTQKKRTQKISAQRKSKEKTDYQYSQNIYRLLKCIYPNLSISRLAMGVMSSFFIDLVDRIASEASTLVYLSKKKTMDSNDIISAAKLVLKSSELSKWAVDMAHRTVEWSKNH